MASDSEDQDFDNDELSLSDVEILEGDRNYGRVRLTFSNGTIYEGEFQKGHINGLGIRTFANGERYEGEFKDGKYEGQGIVYFENGERYEGQFSRGRFFGEGIYYRNEHEDEEGVWYGLGDEFIPKKIEVQIVPWTVEYFEQFGDNIVNAKISNPVTYVRLKKLFFEQIEHSISKTKAIPSRQIQLIEIKETVESLLNRQDFTSVKEDDWV